MNDTRLILTVSKKLSLLCITTVIIPFLTLLSDVAAAPQSCLEFIKPAQWIPVTGNTCTLSVKTCSKVKSISFKAQYIPTDDSLPRIVSIGHITRPPFKLIWDLSKIPNQLTYGITCFAEAELENRKIDTLQQQGIFLTHNPVKPRVYKISYSAHDRFNSNHQSITLSSPILSSTAHANISWNEKNLLFHVDVNNAFFYTTLPQTKLDRLGVKICLDTHNKKSAYLSEEILIFMIPAVNKPYQLIAKSIYNSDGSFDIKETKDTCNYYYSVITENFKGYSVDFAIPQKVLGASIPKTLGCNIIATILDENSSVKELSWIQGNYYTIHSPFAYGKLILLNKPFLANPFLLWLFCFITGLLLGMCAIFIGKVTRKFNTLMRFENLEIEEQYIKNINTIIEAEITNRNFSIADVASRLSLKSNKINKIVKHHFGKTFKKHLFYSRIEIVKERLRSSNASEISIAKSCGFSSVDEMEKTFYAFNGTTPYKYREVNRIA